MFSYDNTQPTEIQNWLEPRAVSDTWSWSQ